MNLYDKYILPSAINWACKQSSSMKQREKVIPLARGKVLEIGIGSGLNLSYYDITKVTQLTAIDSNIEIWKKNTFDTKIFPFEFKFIEASAEQIPVESNNYDTVVITYTLCTIVNVNKAFDEIKRVLKTNGKLIFCEHGKAPDTKTEKWQNLINSMWKKIGGGCNLNRDIPFIIKKNGFKIIKLDTMYIPGWKPASYNYWGVAEIK
ncbi:class I SAM-dependent methyltransferase [Lutibacter sp.]|uniref:class I SAM-dependent methyltransferase n=1 Tax=Lutibacter sp. TaxID=1925666 RepID=UPI00273235F2|nr:class I SAM-dependent methyltransferase [Lutibacter sp.]MDP3314343.1 class I SAM-dependent methyltransferase [Lutibacter sp.]